MEKPAPLHAALQFFGLTAPIAYACLTAAYSNVALPPFIVHAGSDAVLARQWLMLYQAAPAWVKPVLQAAVTSNLALAYLSWGDGGARGGGYVAAALLSGTILPLTFVWFEPGINGACKWKVDRVLKREAEEGGGKGEYKGMAPGRGWWRPSPLRHSATEASRRWAEGTDMKVLVEGWGRRNQVRWVIALASGVVSGWATLGA